jgi:hypothetical protein
MRYIKLFENFQVNESVYIKGIGMTKPAFSDKPGQMGTCYRFADVGHTKETTTGDVGSIHTAREMGFLRFSYIKDFVSALNKDERNLLVLNILYPDGCTSGPNKPPKDDEWNNYCFFFTQFDGEYWKVLDKLVGEPMEGVGDSRDGFVKNKIWFSSSLKGREDGIIDAIGDWEGLFYYNHYGREKK